MDKKNARPPKKRAEPPKKHGTSPQKRTAQQQKPAPRQHGYAKSSERAFSEPREHDEGLVEGKNAVHSALRAGRQMDKIFFASGSIATVGHIVALAREQGVVVQEVDRRKLDQMSQTGAHQGVIALCAAAEYKNIDDILEIAKCRGEKPLLVLCDGITDPHNLGAIIRSAEIAGAHGVVIPRRRSAGLNSACAKAAAGALEHIAVAKCSNINQAVTELKKKGVFVFAADMSGTLMYSLDFTMPCAIIIGAEGDGLSRLSSEQSDFSVKIPQRGQTPSLNASNAAAILLYEALRQRMG